jgi:hypothetical protein
MDTDIGSMETSIATHEMLQAVATHVMKDMTYPLSHKDMAYCCQQMFNEIFNLMSILENTNQKEVYDACLDCTVRDIQHKVMFRNLNHSEK